MYGWMGAKPPAIFLTHMLNQDFKYLQKNMLPKIMLPKNMLIELYRIKVRARDNYFFKSALLSLLIHQITNKAHILLGSL